MQVIKVGESFKQGGLLCKMVQELALYIFAGFLARCVARGGEVAGRIYSTLWFCHC